MLANHFSILLVYCIFFYIFAEKLTMILIADSGSTKTDWCLAESGNVVCRVYTQGINPFSQSEAEIGNVIKNELKPKLPNVNIDKIYFYGSGCRPEVASVVHGSLINSYPDVKEITVESDLLGAARALCGRNMGIACILGTGANSCLFDGDSVLKNTPALGYILGDEGSGAVLGKLFFNAMFKGRLSEKLCREYLDESKLVMADVIRKVYREPLANRFLASTSLFIGKHIQDPLLSALVVDNFRSFLRNNILPYGRKDLPVNAIGSVAYYFKEQLMIAANAEGFTVGEILQSPMDGLLRYHSR
jgi:N-acetylglucosamine kinase-like BadF-type ATPase